MILDKQSLEKVIGTISEFEIYNLVGGLVLHGGKGGGGRRDMAQAGGPEATNAEKALEAIEAAIRG